MVPYHDLKLQNKKLEAAAGLQDNDNDETVTFKDLFIFPLGFIYNCCRGPTPFFQTAYSEGLLT